MLTVIKVMNICDQVLETLAALVRHYMISGEAVSKVICPYSPCNEHVGIICVLQICSALFGQVSVQSLSQAKDELPVSPAP